MLYFTFSFPQKILVFRSIFKFASKSSHTNSVLCCLLQLNHHQKNDSKISHKSTSTPHPNHQPKGFPQLAFQNISYCFLLFSSESVE